MFVLCSTLLLAAGIASVQSKLANSNGVGLFKEVVKDVIEDVAPGWLGEKNEDEKEIADNLSEVIEEDCERVCPPSKEGDFGAHLIQCVQCIAEEFGSPLFPEFLEAVLVIRSPELLAREVDQKQELSDKQEESEGSLSSLENQILEEFGENSADLLEQLSDSFEDTGLALFTALLGPCKDYCDSVTVPNTDPVSCLKCINVSSLNESSQFIDRVLALFST